MSTKVEVVGRNKKISNKDLKLIKKIYQEMYNQWLKESKLTEEELLKYRVVNKFKIKKTVENNMTVVSMTFEDSDKMQQVIGLPFIIQDNSKEALYDAVYIMLYITKKLDEENEINPVEGSYKNNYFNKKIREFATAEGLR